MVLTVYERLLLRNIIPQMSGINFGLMSQARQLVEGLFTEEEDAKLQIKSEGLNTTWRRVDEEGKEILQEREIEIPDGLKTKIGTFLKMLSMQEKLNMTHMTLCEKFVPDWDK